MIPAASGFVGQTFGDGLRRQRADNIAVKSLRDSVNALPPKVSEVRKGFLEVYTVLGNLRSRNGDVPLQRDWKLIAESFDNALEKSRHIALKSAMAIGEFREEIIPYLMDEEFDLESKKPELLEYKKTLHSGQSLASEFLDDLDDIAKELELFKDQVMELGNEDVAKQFKCLKDRFLVLKFRLVRWVLQFSDSRQ
ncbi:hypothetical protein SCHPADRAFT_362441 [Schizopora paradoxa]|uniref:Uncharacterized protein n=1 Tax=Schizopora paradoxa TaxID=27342 RepID=A0A0H2S9E1_9AGAM|nr:hypothetical protein SCHPADRAFT_362441 [Schizopora paradoxa]